MYRMGLKGRLIGLEVSGRSKLRHFCLYIFAAFQPMQTYGKMYPTLFINPWIRYNSLNSAEIWFNNHYPFLMGVSTTLAKQNNLATHLTRTQLHQHADDSLGSVTLIPSMRDLCTGHQSQVDGSGTFFLFSGSSFFNSGWSASCTNPIKVCSSHL